MGLASPRFFDDPPPSQPGRDLGVVSFCRRHAGELIVALVAVLAVGAVVAFDLGPPLASNDDWMYAWSTRKLASGGGLHVFPLAAPLALPQILLGALIAGSHPDPRILRLAAAPFVLVAGLCLYQLARRLGGTRFWSGVAAATLLSSPLFLVGASSYMTDTPYLALLLAAALTAACWLRNGRWAVTTVVLVTAATLQRQSGVLIAPAIVLVFLLSRERRKSTRDWVLLAASILVSGLAVEVPAILRITNDTGSGIIGVGQDLASHGLPLVLLPPMLGLLLLPFAAGFLWRPPSSDGSSVRRRMLVAGVCFIAFAALCGTALHFNRTIFPGNGFSREGLLRDLVLGDRIFFSDPLFIAIEAAALTSFALIFILNRKTWSLSTGGSSWVLIVALALGQFVPLFVLRSYLFDRYYLVPAALLIALAAAAISRTPVSALVQGLTVALLVSSLVIAVAGEQDYQAWQQARDQAARLAYRTVSPADVQAGYSANAVFYALPIFSQTGQFGWLSDGGPSHPRIVLRFAPLGDPRPGVNFYSVRPGRIVLDQP